MADNYWAGLQKDFVAGVREIVDEAREAALQNFFDLTETSSRQERKLFYAGLDWERVRMLAPSLWPRMTADALAIAEADRQAQIKALQDYEHQQYIEAAAFKPQLAPYGYLPTSPAAADLGLGMPLPLGRYGS